MFSYYLQLIDPIKLRDWQEWKNNPVKQQKNHFGMVLTTLG
jgi:hypothetical protein